MSLEVSKYYDSTKQGAEVLKRGKIIVHSPVGAFPLTSSTSVEDKGLLYIDRTSGITRRLVALRPDSPILSGGFLVLAIGGPIRPLTIQVLLVVDRRKTIQDHPSLSLIVLKTTKL
ncbi:hypothetical protein TorRG33x02_272400 [Trema orientale]|uniref:Uncharacterized protein n=1 Tax=Trema orientale TaxID=63057 RepID=A0A2P5CUT1_TREOI|nr:hypothetical protein TorRG33x02_272400 [Trema orientale]